ncbi:hypothetical protein DFH09DRAFT_158265 [Mycena vulgaris]|nr:hypothetical protein DFH09DRAFT_158265 [Mycena vulgaris]
MPNFPPEVWMRIFSFVKDNETFKDIVLTSHQFNTLGQEELVRNMYWKRGEDVQPRLAECGTNSRRHLLKELNVRLVNGSYEAQANVAAMSIFPNLSELTIRNGRITEGIHAALAHLPSLRRLRLQWCTIHPVARALSTPSTVTHLVLHEASTDPDGQHYGGVDGDALRARNLTLIPLPLLHGLDSLFLSSDKFASRPIQQAYALLPDAPNVVHLSVTGPPSPPSTRALRAGPTPLALPALTTFCGPHCIAAEVLPAAAQITELTLTDPISGSQALRIIARLHARAVRSVELTLTRWESEVLYEIAHRFVQCMRIKIVHHYLGPSHEFLFDFGIHHLNRMQALDTLLIRARPRDAMERAPQMHDFPSGEVGEYVRAREQWDAEGKAGLRDVPSPPSVENTRESLAVWTRYNPHLEVIALGQRVWTRAFRGTVWSAEMAKAWRGDEERYVDLQDRFTILTRA